MNLGKRRGTKYISMTSSSSMKIAIAKTLLEPVGIPWPIQMDGSQDLLTKIEQELHDYFQYLLHVIKLVPGKEQELHTISAKAICDMLWNHAIDSGASGAIVKLWDIKSYNEQRFYDVGHRYEVTFSTPGNKKTRKVQLDNYFE